MGYALWLMTLALAGGLGICMAVRLERKGCEGEHRPLS